MPAILEECWADEGGYRFRVRAGEKEGDRILAIVDITNGWPGEEVSRVSIAAFRTMRIAEALIGRKIVQTTEPANTV
jgi:KaiC/GvpD/RAD55 family RecA-like ATPase